MVQAYGTEDGKTIQHLHLTPARRPLLRTDRTHFHLRNDGTNATLAYLCTRRFAKTATTMARLSLPNNGV